MHERNLLVISNNFPNQDNTFTGNIFVKEQIKYLSNNFDNVYVISPVASGIEHIRGISYRDYRIDNIQVFFPKYTNIPLFWKYGRPIWVNLETRAIKSLVEREHLQFNLIHAHFTWPSGAVAINLKKTYNVPVIITEHTSITFLRAIESQDPLFNRTWSEANKIIRVKKSDISAFSRLHIPISKVVSIPNGYDSEHFYPMDTQKCREILQLPSDKKIILNVGNLYSDLKGHKYLIEAVSNVVKKRADILFVIVGDGKLRPVLERQIHALGLDDYIMLVGGRPHHEIPTWINACDIFVLPSLNEGNPTVMFEALGCGKPFVGTKVGGVPEVITSNEFGLLVEPADSRDLAEKILKAFEKEWDRESILKYSKQYTWERISKNIMDVYDQVLG